MTDSKPTQGNIVDAIKALQEGARVFERLIGSESEVTLHNSAELMVDVDTYTPITIYANHAQDDAFRIEWLKPRTPKRGEIWQSDDGVDRIVFAVYDGLVFYSKEGTYFGEYKMSELWLSARYTREATPGEMAQFDGG